MILEVFVLFLALDQRFEIMTFGLKSRHLRQHVRGFPAIFELYYDNFALPISLVTLKSRHGDLHEHLLPKHCHMTPDNGKKLPKQFHMTSQKGKKVAKTFSYDPLPFSPYNGKQFHMTAENGKKLPKRFKKSTRFLYCALSQNKLA